MYKDYKVRASFIFDEFCHKNIYKSVIPPYLMTQSIVLLADLITLIWLFFLLQVGQNPKV